MFSQGWTRDRGAHRGKGGDEVSFDARDGRGCSHCEVGTPMAWFGARGGHVVRLCIGCLLEWFPGRSAAWLEERLDYYIDHVDYRLAVAHWKEAQRAKASGPKKPVKSEFVVKVPPLKRKN